MSLDWSSFEILPGDPRNNFETLCRGIVRMHWGKYGHFNALKNQPGVEFHIKLNQNCDVLGDSSRWYGWQCKKFERTTAGDLKSASKTDIEDSLQKTEKVLPELTDWVLWTPFTLSKKDQDWFNGLRSNYPFNLHLWTEEEINNYLSGPALLLRESYFGELVVTPDNLENQHKEAIASIKGRWLYPVHQEIDVERILRRMLGEPGAWSDMAEIGKNLSAASEIIEKFTTGISDLDQQKKSFVDACKAFSSMLLNFHEMLADGDIEVIQQWLNNRKFLLIANNLSFPRLLRKRNISLALETTNALDDIRIAQGLFDEVASYLEASMVAVLADAGGGKTHMAAQITAAQKDRPAGVLLHGKHFHRSQNQNDLARWFSVNGTPISSMEKLLASVDAAAKRAHCRLPLVIDGLNEAENPKEWKDVLTSIKEIAIKYSNVLVICTLRTGEHNRSRWPNSHYDSETRESFAVQALPKDIDTLECEGFGENLYNALVKYFDYYRIKCEISTEIPEEFLNHPLNLRIFCDVTNPKREKSVEITYFPASLANLFDEYIRNACDRVAEMKNMRYGAKDINDSVYKLGIGLWEKNDREICDKAYRESIQDQDREWNESIVNLLAQEGIVFRNPGKEPGVYVITPAYDALGGHIIADALLKKNAQDRSFKWISDSFLAGCFSGENSHPLSHDIFKSLVALVPSRMYGQQLWKNIPDLYKSAALLFAIELNAKYIDEDTVKALSVLIKNSTHQRHKIFSRLWLTKGAINHPLNSDFLDVALRDMDVAERDLSWTEWVRRDRGRIIEDLSSLESKWIENISMRTGSDRLRVKALAWLLTSTDHPLRNAATKSLYWFGRGDPEFFFDLTIKSLSINDPYVSERMLAASYGVAMALSTKVTGNTSFTNGTLAIFAGKIYEAMFVHGAVYKTTHQFACDFASRIIELAQYYNPNYFSEENLKRTKPPFTVESLSEWGEVYLDEDVKISKRRSKKYPIDLIMDKLKRHIFNIIPKKWIDNSNKEKGRAVRQSPFYMDFENYTIGRLIPDRGNYDYDHAEYKKVKAQLLWRVYQLGWSHEKFKSVEESIVGGQRYERIGNEKLKTDRYGKKYSWIAYYEMLGFLRDNGVLEERDWWRTETENIDPSFLSTLDSQKLLEDNYLGNPSVSTQDWIKYGEKPNFTPYLKLNLLEGIQGPWIALDGHINQENKDIGRSTFFFIRSFLVYQKDKEQIISHLSKDGYEGHQLPQKPDLYNTFWGEVPWSETFLDNSDCDLSFVIAEKTVTKKMPKVEIIKDDQGIKIVTHDEAEEYQVTEYEYDKIKVINAVCDLKRDVTDGGVGNITTLAKDLALSMELIGQPQSFDLYTKSGDIATRYINYNKNGYKNSHSLFYIREDLLKKIMKEKDLSLVWVIWGERNYAFHTPHYHHHDLPEPRYAVFKNIQIY